VIDVALIRVAICAVLVQIAPIMIDVLLVRIAVGAILRQVPLIMIDIALIRVAIRTVLCEVFLIASNVFLVVLNVLLLRSRILALGIRTTGEQTGKSNREHTSTDHMFCVHRVVSYRKRSWVTPHLQNETLAGGASFAA